MLPTDHAKKLCGCAVASSSFPPRPGSSPAARHRGSKVGVPLLGIFLPSPPVCPGMKKMMGSGMIGSG